MAEHGFCEGLRQSAAAVPDSLRELGYTKERSPACWLAFLLRAIDSILQDARVRRMDSDDLEDLRDLFESDWPLGPIKSFLATVRKAMIIAHSLPSRRLRIRAVSLLRTVEHELRDVQLFMTSNPDPHFLQEAKALVECRRLCGRGFKKIAAEVEARVMSERGSVKGINCWKPRSPQNKALVAALEKGITDCNSLCELVGCSAGHARKTTCNWKKSKIVTHKKRNKR